MRTFFASESYFKALAYAAAMMNRMAEDLGCLPKYRVGDCYYDYGLDWMWTTIIYGVNGEGFQALSPDEWHKIILADYSCLKEIVSRQAKILEVLK